MKKEYWFIAIGFVIVAVMLSGKQGLMPSTNINTIAGSWDISEQVKTNGYDQYLVEEPDFNYNDPSIYSLAQNIKSSTSTPKQAITETIKYVVTNVDYQTVPLTYCYSEKASDVLKNGHGDCVSMSRLVTALLRAQGIPARTMGGCLSMKNKCSALMAAVPGAEPQFTPMSIGDFKKRGFLHEYVSAYDGSKWVLIESTAGIIYDMSCQNYLLYSYDTNAKNRCEINDNDFWQMCSEA